MALMLRELLQLTLRILSRLNSVDNIIMKNSFPVISCIIARRVTVLVLMAKKILKGEKF